jgi:hypothetical protein
MSIILPDNTHYLKDNLLTIDLYCFPEKEKRGTEVNTMLKRTISF